MLYVLMGKSAAGKDTIQNFLVKEKGFIPLISMTSRPMREAEVNGREYHFVSKEEFRRKIDEKEMLEYRIYYTLVNGIPDEWYYGFPVYQLDDSKNYVAIIDTYGAGELLKYYGDKTYRGIYVVADRSLREKRAKERGSFDKTEWDRRAKDDDVRFQRDKVEPLTDFYIINNGELSITFENLVKELRL